MGQCEIGAFLSNLATEHNVAASTQNQACSALEFPYSEVLHKDLSGLDQNPLARRPARVPLVLSRHGPRWRRSSANYVARPG